MRSNWGNSPTPPGCAAGYDRLRGGMMMQDKRQELSLDDPAVRLRVLLYGED
ncbi:MAG: hypothetical protein HY319_22990 [Armatimonadetes bacterium]|nr:hypothetical protein [Armatimonadota bacterium]